MSLSHVIFSQIQHTTMKHILPILSLFLLAGTFFLGSCEKFSDNGDIDGLWIMTERYSRATDAPSEGYPEKTDVGQRSISWAFQLKLMSIRTPQNHNGHTAETVGRFSLHDGMLDVEPLYIHFRDRDSLLTDPQTTCLKDVGIYGNSGHFRVSRLSENHMVLCSDRDSLVFRKS